jgi:hypothetical protein
VITFGWAYVELRYVRYVTVSYLLGGVIVIGALWDTLGRVFKGVSSPTPTLRTVVGGLVLSTALVYTSLQLYTLQQEADGVASKQTEPISDVTYSPMVEGPADWGVGIFGSSPCSADKK